MRMQGLPAFLSPNEDAKKQKNTMGASRSEANTVYPPRHDIRVIAHGRGATLDLHYFCNREGAGFFLVLYLSDLSVLRPCFRSGRRLLPVLSTLPQPSLSHSLSLLLNSLSPSPPLPPRNVYAQSTLHRSPFSISRSLYL